MGTPRWGVDATPLLRCSRCCHWPRILLASLVAAAGIVATVAAPAGADPAYGSVVNFQPPTPQAGTAISGVQHVKVQASAVGIVTAMRVTFLSDDPSIPAFQEYVDHGPTISTSETFETDWDTGKLAHNGVYRLEASALTCGGRSCGLVEAKRTGLLVANPPATPEGVQAELRDGVSVVRWSANKEADLVGYWVFRTARGTTALAGTVAAAVMPIFVDQGAPDGTGVSYSVVAVRRSPVATTDASCSEFRTSCATSGASPGTDVIAIPAAPAPGGGTAPGNGARHETTVIDPAPAAPPAPAPPAPPAPRAAPAPPAAPAAPPPPAPGAQAPPPAPATRPAPATKPAAPPAVLAAQPQVLEPEVLIAPPSADAPAPVAEAPAPATQDQPAQQQLEVVAPPSSDHATDRLESTTADRTATVVTLLLFGLGFFGVFKARRLIGSRR